MIALLLAAGSCNSLPAVAVTISHPQLERVVLALAFDHVALREVLNALDPTNARAPDCSVPVWPLIGG